MLHTLLHKPLPWLSATGPYAEYVLYSAGVLVRNLTDLPFPGRCNDEERHASEERILAALDHAGLASRGQYVSARSMDSRELRFLGERGILTPRPADGEDSPPAHTGIFLADDQSFSICINGDDHVAIQSFASGANPDAIWTRLDQVDEALAPSLDYAFNDRLGYLTSEVRGIGTALRIRATVHVPALALHNGIEAARQSLWQDKNEFSPFVTESAVGKPATDLYTVGNTATLGRAEPEIVFHVNHAVSTVIAREKSARTHWHDESRRGFEDRVGRALGIAQGARLLEAAEAQWLLSSIRLGVVAGIAEGIGLAQLNELHMALQPAHLEVEEGRDCDELTLSAKRADVFRSRFS